MRIESDDAVGPPGTISFFTMLVLKAALYSVTFKPHSDAPSVDVLHGLNARSADRTTPLTQGGPVPPGFVLTPAYAPISRSTGPSIATRSRFPDHDGGDDEATQALRRRPDPRSSLTVAGDHDDRRLGDYGVVASTMRRSCGCCATSRATRSSSPRPYV